MILQSLVAHYEDLLSQGQISKPGWGKVNISYALNLDEQGNIVGFSSLKTLKETGKKKVYVPQQIEVPQPVKRSVDVNSNFLCDNSTYILGVDEKGKQDRTLQCYQACKNKHYEILKIIDTPAARAIVNFFDKWVPSLAKECSWLVDDWKDLMAGANILFYYDGHSVIEDEKICKAWQEYYDNSDTLNQNICMITGKKTSMALLHPTIKGVRGAQAMGTSLVSFNAASFCSYEKEQGNNAPISEYAAFAYATALNELLNDSMHTRTIGDATVVFWAEGGDKSYQDMAMAFMYGADEDNGFTDQDLASIMDCIRQGKPVEVDDKSLDMDKHFYILGLAPNAARLAVRFFMQDSFGNILKNIDEHNKRMMIVKPSYDKYAILPVWKMLSETVNQNAKDKTPSPQMAADTLKAILTNSNYPASLLNGVMLRIKAEHNVTRGKAAIIKAYYSRNTNKYCSKEVLQMGLNEDCRDVAYTLGRLFAVLEHIQQEANPGINATIKDKYFNTAASIPAQIFPVLVNLSQKHLRKLGDGSKIYFNKKIGELSEIIGTEYPKRLNMPQQGSFQLGYYCQTQKRYEKREEK